MAALGSVTVVASLRARDEVVVDESEDSDEEVDVEVDVEESSAQATPARRASASDQRMVCVG